jgi:hypothetical protein
MSIYVEIRIRGGMDELWRRTQDPGLHERWDLRFSEIVYLPRPDETRPQRAEVLGAGHSSAQMFDSRAARKAIFE